MPVSMTGFGRHETIADDFSHVWEIRSVNNRFLDMKWRMPSVLRSLETRFEKILRKNAARGRVDVSLSVETRSAALLGVSLNTAQAGAMLDQLRALAAIQKVEFTPDLNRLISASHLWRDDSVEPDPGLAASLEQGLKKALQDWNSSRRVEGEELARDLKERFARLRVLAAAVGERVPVVLKDKQAATAERLNALVAQAGMTFTEERLAQEVAVLADRLDVSEEITRLAAHLDRLEEAVSSDGEAGKRLDFLIQEAFREINTCGNKAQDVELSRLTVEFKVELEKCREQVQNLE
ncbi:MAG: YicC/YloC family endoribonuclease [Humidesulfovibrio sp.]|uniref:YicC/YloC family endoribonuclease n=1 Tax=Humidesulfovibrio sp. TaxID=2910988 RepID=UPI0027F66DC2|nr:YicC/YloC family endoribonuclease [Humidesulfovibrio sp.]MDQ7834144.1 YicC/YloC family endoribonuclease [Humidesulfovibrio sp.]